MRYEQTLLRLKKLLLAQAAMREAVQLAIEDVIAEAAKEGRGPAESGLYVRFDLVTGEEAPPNPRAAEVEHLVQVAWSNAHDDEERDRVRALVRATVSRRLLTPDAEARLLKLIA